jgi:hypothetical protein
MPKSGAFGSEPTRVDVSLPLAGAAMTNAPHTARTSVVIRIPGEGFMVWGPQGSRA